MIYLGSDHAGFGLKEKLKKFLKSNNIEFCDLTPKHDENDDYPDAAEVVAKRVVSEKAKGVLICGTGMGVCMAANKIKGARAALAYTEEAARLAKEHNNANIICFGGRTMDIVHVQRAFLAWNNASFRPEPRHVRRIDKIDKMS